MVSTLSVKGPENTAPPIRYRALGAMALWLAACSSDDGSSVGSGSGGVASASGGTVASAGGAKGSGGSPVTGGGGVMAGRGGNAGAGAAAMGGSVGGTGVTAGGGGAPGTGGNAAGGTGLDAGRAGAVGTGGANGGGSPGTGGAGAAGGGATGKGGAGAGGSGALPLGPPGPFACTQLIGYSQTEQWFSAFEAEVTNAKWELRWAGGHGVDVWKNPGDSGWNAALVSACAEGSNDVERVMFSISGPHGSNVSAWEADIDAFMSTVRGKLPNAHVFILEPVVGGPNMNCSRADEQNPSILEAIKNVAARDPEVFVGHDAHVSSCSGFQDSLGHLTSSAASQIGAEKGAFYSSNLPDP